MTSQYNEYADLLKYLESQDSKPKEVAHKATSDFKKSKRDKTKQLLKESIESIHSDVEIGTPIKQSKGFDVYNFESLMRSKLIDEHKRIQSYDRPYISVTELISCIRQKYYARMKYSINVKKKYQFSYLYMINQVGDLIHNLIQELYDHTEVEKPIISEKFKVKGRVDGLRHNFLIEYKTIDKGKFKEKYLDIHYWQAIIYAYILNTEYNYNIDTITIVYITRDLKRIIPFDLPLNDELAIDFLNRGLLLKQAIESKTVPAKIGATNEQCKYCPYAKYCKKEKKSRQDNKSVFLI